MKKPRDKTKEELAAEGYVDTDSSDVKITTNIESKKEIPLAQTAKTTTTKEVLEKTLPTESIVSKSIRKESTKPDRDEIETIESSPTRAKRKYTRSNHLLLMFLAWFNSIMRSFTTLRRNNHIFILNIIFSQFWFFHCRHGFILISYII